nr:tetraspanin-1 [Pelodiscus sinensis]|eukprot:XP_006117397.1 tetraspanin-1 [Pelodiscus sinensis]
MGCFTFLKVMMILFNLAIFLGGGALLGVGIWVAVDSSSFSNLFGSTNVLQFVNISYFLIVIGAILVVLGFLGCCGAQKESKCLLIMFFSIVLIIFIAEIAAAVVALVYTSLVSQGVERPQEGQVGGANATVTPHSSSSPQVKCCGLTNYTDFTDSYYYQTNNHTYPPFCCDPVHSPCNRTGAETSKVQGCFQQLLSDVRQNAGVVGGVAAGICALEIAAMVVSMYLYCHLDKK